MWGNWASDQINCYGTDMYSQEPSSSEQKPRCYPTNVGELTIESIPRTCIYPHFTGRKTWSPQKITGLSDSLLRASSQEPRFPMTQSWVAVLGEFPFSLSPLCSMPRHWLILSLSRRWVLHSQMDWVQRKGRFSASPRCSCCAKSCRFLRMSRNWPRSSP